MRNLFTAAGLSLLAVACATESAEPAGPPPTLRVTSPERGTISDRVGPVEVRGTVAPGEEGGSPVDSVVVNGVRAVVAADGSFTATVSARPGATMIETIATDETGAAASDTRTMLAGAQTTSDALIADAMTAAISAEAFDKMGEVAANMMGDADIAGMMADKNPVLNVGAPDGEDCLWVKGSLEAFQMSEPNINLIPYDGGLRLEVDLYNVEIPIDMRYAVACVDGHDGLVISASRVSLDGELDLWAENGEMRVDLHDMNIDLEDLDLDATGVPGAILDIFNIDGLIEWVFELGVEQFMEPTINEMLPTMAGVSKEMDLMGHTVAIDVIPGAIDFDVTGARMRMDSRMAVEGAEGGFIFTENSLPAMDTSSGFEIGLADDAANQLLTGFWSVGGLAMELPMEAGFFNTAKVDAMLPPVLSAQDGSLNILIGDLGLKFLQDKDLQGEVALNISIGLKVEGTGDIVKLVPGEPVVHIDYMDEVENKTGFNAEDLEAIIQLVVDHELEKIEPLLGAIPLPSIGGVALDNLDVAGKAGYVTVSGALQ